MRQITHTPTRKNRRYAGERAFFAVLFILSIFALCALLRGDSGPLSAVGEASLRRRTAEGLFEEQGKKRDLEVSSDIYISIRIRA